MRPTWPTSLKSDPSDPNSPDHPTPFQPWSLHSDVVKCGLASTYLGPINLSKDPSNEGKAIIEFGPLM